MFFILQINSFSLNVYGSVSGTYINQKNNLISFCLSVCVLANLWNGCTYFEVDSWRFKKYFLQDIFLQVINIKNNICFSFLKIRTKELMSNITIKSNKARGQYHWALVDKYTTKVARKKQDLLYKQSSLKVLIVLEYLHN